MRKASNCKCLSGSTEDRNPTSACTKKLYLIESAGVSRILKQFKSIPKAPIAPRFQLMARDPANIILGWKDDVFLVEACVANLKTVPIQAEHQLVSKEPDVGTSPAGWMFFGQDLFIFWSA